jgi:outer membrane protein assembly factor BamB
MSLHSFSLRPAASRIVPSAWRDASRGRRALRRAAGLACAFAALSAVAADDWPQYQRDAARSGVATAPTTLTNTDLGPLQVEWKALVFGASFQVGGVTIDAKHMFIGTQTGQLWAFAADGCGKDVCQATWQGTADNGIYGTPAISEGRVVFASADHFLYVFDADGCGQGVRDCAPLWRGQLAAAALFASPAIAGGMIYIGDDSGQLSAFPLAGCDAALCAPAWTGHAPGHESIDSTPAVGDGFVFVQTTIGDLKNTISGGRLVAFPAAGCGRATCDAAWTADVKGPAGNQSGPTVAGDKVIVASNRRTVFPNGREHVFAFAAAGCSAAVCKPIQTFDVGFNGSDKTPTVSGSTLLVANDNNVTRNDRAIVSAFDLDACGLDCQPLWTGANQTAGAISAPAVAGDLVFVGKGPATPFEHDAAVAVFDIHGCGKRICTPLEFVQSATDALYEGAPLAIAHDLIAFAAPDAGGGVAMLGRKRAPSDR